MADVLIEPHSTGTDCLFERRSVAIAGTRHGNVGAVAGSGRPAASAVAGWLSLAAAPTFAIMALVSFISASGRTDMICSATMPDMSPLTGMIAMYVLMSLFHLAPWVRLVSDRRNRAEGG